MSEGAIVLALLELGLGAAVPAGRNCARITAMSLSVVGTTSAFLGTVQGSEVIGLTSLPTVGSAILVLLALSSHRAREYATRHRTREVE